jgi:hypothetical protein
MMVISQQSSQLEEPIVRPANPPTAFDIPPGAPFVLLFAKKRVVAVVFEDEPKPEEEPKEKPKPKPTATDAHTTGWEGSNPRPDTHEDLDWENDD